MTALRSVPAVSRLPRTRGRRRARALLFVLLLAALFTAYLRLSRTYPENSDEANLLLMASDWAHGNFYLSGWTVSDVPFITTELPELALAVRLFGLHLNTAHIVAAFTYTVVLALALLLSSGGTTPRTPLLPPGWTTPRTPLSSPGGTTPRTPRGRPVARAATVPDARQRTGITRSSGWRSSPRSCSRPQAGVGVFVLLFSVGHIGTAAPVLLTWLFLDRAAGRRPWAVALVTGLLLAWALMADPLVLVIGVGPLLLVTALRAAAGPRAPAGLQSVTGITAVPPNEGGLRRFRPLLATRRLELSLAVAAAAACLVAWGGQRLLRAAGRLHPASRALAARPGQHLVRPLPHGGARPAGHVRRLLPARRRGRRRWPRCSPLSRLACVALAAAGVLTAARRFFRRDADLVSQLLLTGLVANLAAYIPSSLADHTALNAREFAPVLPFAAVLAARMLGDRLGRWLGGSRVRAAALALLLGLVRPGPGLSGRGGAGRRTRWPGWSPTSRRTTCGRASAGTGTPAPSRWTPAARSPSGRLPPAACSRTPGRPGHPGTTRPGSGPRSWSPRPAPATSAAGSPRPRRCGSSPRWFPPPARRSIRGVRGGVPPEKSSRAWATRSACTRATCWPRCPG